MEWLWDLIALFTEKVLKLDMTSRLGGSVHFFIYDTIKIFILLITMIYLISYIQAYLPPEKTRFYLSKLKGLKANIVGSLLGVITPFCSCSSIPIFIGFLSGGLSLGPTFSFLIASPMIDLASLILLVSFFGYNIAAAYMLVGLIISVVGGLIIEKLKLEAYVEDYVWDIEEKNIEKMDSGQINKRAYARGQVRDLLSRIWPYILLGVGIGASIHNLIPEEFISKILGKANPFSVIIASFIGLPMYGDIFGTLPIAQALLNKGVEVGTVVSFMMGVTTLSIPSLIMLSKVVKPRLLASFITIVVVGIIIVGYGLNFIFA